MEKIIHVEGSDLEYLISQAQSALERGAYLRVTIDGGVKVCDGQRMWTPALGEQV